jgi:large subunit ribosomal protein L23
MQRYDVIKGPVVTEKSANQGSLGNKVVFWVDLNASKLQIRDAVENLFTVKVQSINTSRIPGKQKRLGRYTGKTSTRKKAYVTLKEGENMEKIFGSAAQ